MPQAPRASRRTLGGTRRCRCISLFARFPTAEVLAEMKIPQEIRDLLASCPACHLTTLNPDGSPQVTVNWFEVRGDEIVSGHFKEHIKLRNVRRNPRIALSIAAPTKNAIGLQEYAVIYGEARVEEGGAPEIVRRLADIYIEPGSAFPPANSPSGYTLCISVKRITGIGPWATAKN